MKLKEGSLFSGYHGLGMGVSSVLDVEPVWFSEFDKGPSKILAHRFPGVPNHGDITKIQWVPTCGAYEFDGCGRKATVLPDRSGWQCHHCQKLWPTAIGKVYWPEIPEPVDVLTGGSPCQDLSHAGARAGMSEGTRSNLWVAMREAIAQLKPSLVVWENVGGAFSANASSEVEPCAGCVGDGSGSVLRALGRVLGDLASLGFDAEWTALRAADVGAPHGRLRVFVVAYPHGEGRGGFGRLYAVGRDSDGRGREDGSGSSAQPAALLPTPTASDSNGAGIHGDGGLDLRTAVTVLPTPTKRDWKDHTIRREPHRPDDMDTLARALTVTLLPTGIAVQLEWGQYAAAIQRWESLTRPAPAPTELGPKGTPRLSAAFSEWMMGLPAGWVTDVPGITRNEALKALGNGVVPQQAAAALRSMLASEVAA